MKEKIWLSSPHMGGTEQQYVQEAFDTNWIAPLGPHVNEFESSLENYLGTQKKVAAVSSGTAAIHLALILSGVQQGDTVLCQSFTFSASANPITYLGATPIFIDSESTTWNMDPSLLEIAIKDGIKINKKPKAIIAVHLYGMPFLANEIREIADYYKIPLIEDAAEALGSHINNEKCGTFGDFGILSFNGNKIITTSGGGALITKTQEDKKKAIFLATQARDDAPHYQHSHIGYNYRMSNVLAGIGRGQMEVLKDRVNQRRKNFEFYKKELSAKGLIFLEEPHNFFANRWLTCVLTDSFEKREKIRVYLMKHNIETRPLWKPMHLQPVFKNYKNYNSGIAEKLFDVGLCLPSGSNLKQDTLEKIVREIKSVL
ncbi:MAG: DegT/DnrJ/EryC1/StrS family aminotransferase [Lutibacter sp.]